MIFVTQRWSSCALCPPPRQLRYAEYPLSELLREDSQNGLSPRPSDVPPGVPILRISAATSRTDAVVDESDYKFLEVSARDMGKYQLRPGDLLACRFNGNLHFVGRFALFKGESGEPRLYPDKLIRFRVDTERILAEFVTMTLVIKGVH
jgi:type I restriction enzyme, S subunit